jgi:hypothetical protein
MNPAGATMSELKRNQSLFRQSAPAARAPCRSAPAAPSPKPAMKPAELCLLESWEDKAVPGGDPYNGIGSRAHR